MEDWHAPTTPGLDTACVPVWLSKIFQKKHHGRGGPGSAKQFKVLFFAHAYRRAPGECAAAGKPGVPPVQGSGLVAGRQGVEPCPRGFGDHAGPGPRPAWRPARRVLWLSCGSHTAAPRFNLCRKSTRKVPERQTKSPGIHLGCPGLRPPAQERGASNRVVSQGRSCRTKDGMACALSQSRHPARPRTTPTRRGPVGCVTNVRCNVPAWEPLVKSHHNGMG